MSLRRGFKSEANWYARSLRQELGLPPHEKICPWQLSVHLGFKVLGLSGLACANPATVAFFREGRGRDDFSAVTLPDGEERWIIHNDGHDPKRQAANIAHEVAHGLLNHPLHPLLDEPGRRHFNAEIEEEANWLGPALLISDEAAVLIARRAYTLEQASDIYGVSIDLVRFRLNVSGAFRRRAA